VLAKKGSIPKFGQARILISENLGGPITFFKNIFYVDAFTICWQMLAFATCHNCYAIISMKGGAKRPRSLGKGHWEGP